MERRGRSLKSKPGVLVVYDGRRIIHVEEGKNLQKMILDYIGNNDWDELFNFLCYAKVREPNTRRVLKEAVERDLHKPPETNRYRI